MLILFTSSFDVAFALAIQFAWSCKDSVIYFEMVDYSYVLMFTSMSKVGDFGSS